MTTIKLSYNNEIRRLYYKEEEEEDHNNNNINYNSFIETISTLFHLNNNDNNSNNNNNIKLSWLDDENDLIILTTEKELNEAILVMKKISKNGYVRFNVIFQEDNQTNQINNNNNQNENSENNENIKGVKCHHCGINIQDGVVYQSITDLVDYFCENCEEKFIISQRQPLIKLYHLNQQNIVDNYFKKLSQQNTFNFKLSNRGISITSPTPSNFNLSKHRFVDQDSDWRKTTTTTTNNNNNNNNSNNNNNNNNGITQIPPIVGGARSISSAISTLTISTSTSSTTSNEQSCNRSPNIFSKLMCRFIRDVSFSDGENVLPSITFVKTWRIKNDGRRSWPNNCVLASAGGDDLLFGEETILPPANPGEEIDVSVTLLSPTNPGRYVSYFRPKTEEGKWFGQRLWADIRVVIPEVDNFDINDVIQNSMEQQYLNNNGDNNNDDNNDNTQIPDSIDNDEIIISFDQEETTPLTPQLEHQEQNDKYILWENQLSILASMGFINKEDCIIRLEKYSNSSRTSPEILQLVVFDLLNGS